MTFPDDIFLAATAKLFGDETEAPLGAGGEDSGSLVGTAAASTTEGKGVVGIPPPVSTTEKLKAERLKADALRRRQIDAQSDAPDFP